MSLRSTLYFLRFAQTAGDCYHAPTSIGSCSSGLDARGRREPLPLRKVSLRSNPL